MCMYGRYRSGYAKKKVAVYMTGNDVDQAYKKVIGAKLVSAITASGEYAAVERTADFLAALSAENDYQSSGEVRDSQIAQLGQKFGVKFVVVADVSELFDELFIASRLINVETGLVERAFDANGQAESMAQLIKLSQDVAAGLLTGVSSSGDNASSFSSTPQHLALCVMDKYGKILYITAEQWQHMSEGLKVYYTKKGVCLLNNGEGFLVALSDVASGNFDYARRMGAPDYDQLMYIGECMDQLNAVLAIFGGDSLLRDDYWTSHGYSSGAMFVVLPKGGWGIPEGSIRYEYKRVRPVYDLPGIKH